MNATYNPLNPATPGFASGTFIDGSTVFPGIADFICSTNRVSRISGANSATKPAGAYSTCGKVEVYNAPTAKYFCNHPQLTWVTTNFAGALAVDGVISKVAGTATMVLARINITNPTGTFQQVAFVVISPTNFVEYHDGSAGYSGAYPGSIEVLACPPPTTPTTLAPSTAVNPYVTGCRLVFDFTSTVNGATKIIKKGCMMAWSLNHTEAVKNCNGRGMPGLFAITDQSQYDQLNNFLMTWNPTSGPSLHIDGVLLNGFRYVFNPNQSPLYHGAYPTFGTGEFMTINGNGTRFNTRATSAGVLSWFICEYFKF